MNNLLAKKDLLKISDNLFEIPKHFRSDMRVPARIYANEHMLEKILLDRSLWQIVNVTTLPGIQKYALAMADIHEGYGFPIGGVAAMAIDEDGVISPGGIGYDINCGVRLLACDIGVKDVRDKISLIAEAIFRAVPSGVGRPGFIKMNNHDLERVLKSGASRMVELGFGSASDLSNCEESGSFDCDDVRVISEHAKDRGREQLGTLGSGNHFLELQMVDEIFDHSTASVFGLFEGQLTAMIHCGSRGLGHQVCTDYVRAMLSSQHNNNLIDRQLAYAPFNSPEGQDYFLAMKEAANFAWANRHLIGHHIRKAIEDILGSSARVRTVYDVAHNIGKIETHTIQGQNKKLLVHRKGATRAFGPRAQGLTSKYMSSGQPVLVPGTMGTSSYVMVGTSAGMKSAFGSACHGAGRAMSRMAAKKQASGRKVQDDLLAQGIIVCCDSSRGLAEEAPYAYKDIEEVVSVVHNAVLASKVARLKPLAVIKGD